jgi:hypothetical protein
VKSGKSHTSFFYIHPNLCFLSTFKSVSSRLKERNVSQALKDWADGITVSPDARSTQAALPLHHGYLKQESKDKARFLGVLPPVFPTQNGRSQIFF